MSTTMSDLESASAMYCLREIIRAMDLELVDLSDLDTVYILLCNGVALLLHQRSVEKSILF